MKTALLSALPLMAMIGCAHAEKKEVETAQPQLAPVNTKPAAAPAAPPETTTSDLDALLKGLAVHFEFDKYDLTPDSRKRLDNLADAMRANPTAHIKVAGNADELGTEEYNLALGQKRADAVKDYLDKLGVAKTRVDTVSYGEEKPVDDRHNAAAWEANRRGDVSKEGK